jgi:UDP-glucose 4-epimerase
VSERILVTGASGFIGTPLVSALTRAGRQVRAATRHSQAASFPRGVEVVVIPDLRQSIDWAPMLAGVDKVVHLAGLAHVGSRAEPAVYDRVNHLATADLAAACARAGVRRLVFLSSVRAQCGAATAQVLRETDEPCPSEPYGQSKLMAEAAVRACGGAWTILRPVMVYGPGAKGNLAGLMRVCALPLPLPFARFANRRSILGLENLVTAIAFVLGEEACARETFLVADPKPLTLAEIVAALRCGAGRRPHLFPIPPAAIETGLRLIGRADVWERLGGALAVDPGKLIAAGWRPDPDTGAGLARMVQAAAATGVPKPSDAMSRSWPYVHLRSALRQARRRRQASRL